MPRTRPPYPAEFREKIVALARDGRPASERAEEFEPSEQTIRTWLQQADADEGLRTDALTTAEREELSPLRKEDRRRQQERDMLAKAAARFARETGSIPSSSS